MFPVIQIGPMALQAPGLILLIGLWIGLIIAERLAERFNARPQHIYNLVFITLIAGIIAARLSFVVRHLEAFRASPLSLFSLNPGLLDPVGGVAIGLFAALIYGSRKQIPVWPTLDALTPLLAVMIITNGLKNLASGAAFGAATDLPWAIELWGMYRHPTQIYQMIAGIIILVMIWPRRSASDAPQRVSGVTFWFFLALSSVSWLIIEAFRGDSVLLPGGWRIAQIVAWMILAVSLWGIGKLLNPSEKSPENL